MKKSCIQMELRMDRPIAGRTITRGMEATTATTTMMDLDEVAHTAGVAVGHHSEAEAIKTGVAPVVEAVAVMLDLQEGIGPWMTMVAGMMGITTRRNQDQAGAR